MSEYYLDIGIQISKDDYLRTSTTGSWFYQKILNPSIYKNPKSSHSPAYYYNPFVEIPTVLNEEELEIIFPQEWEGYESEHIKLLNHINPLLLKNGIGKIRSVLYRKREELIVHWIKDKYMNSWSDSVQYFFEGKQIIVSSSQDGKPRPNEIYVTVYKDEVKQYEGWQPLRNEINVEGIIFNVRTESLFKAFQPVYGRLLAYLDLAVDNKKTIIWAYHFW